MKRFLRCLLGACALHLTVSAHVLDQYLQTAQIALAPNHVRIELRLIPGVQVADRIGKIIDLNNDGQISTAEAQSYTQRVSHDIALLIDGINIPLTLTDTQFPSLTEMREGLGTIRLTYDAPISRLTADHQQLYFRNNHLPELGVYLVNALLPTTNAIKLGEQVRDPLQRELRFDYYLAPASTTQSWRGIAVLLFCLFLLLWRQLRHVLRIPFSVKNFYRPNSDTGKYKLPKSL